MSEITTTSNGVSKREFYYKVIKDLGIPTVFLIAVLCFYSGYLPSPLLSHALGSPKHWDQTQRLLFSAELNTRLLVQICRNTAKTPGQLERCEGSSGSDRK